MSTKAVEKEIEKFLSSAGPEVICLSGKWGVGKTYAWNQYLERYRKSIALEKYAYVSLFGINSLDELKYSIFENSIKKELIGSEPDLDSLQENTVAAADRLTRKSLWFLQQLPFAKNYIGGLGPVWFGTVKKHLICIDDVERRGKDLSIRDVLGLISNLKERKNCKVVLILNDDALGEDEKEKADFDKYLEKVADGFLKFEPTPLEAAEIAFKTGDELSDSVSRNCITLGITNIRVIKKLERFARQALPIFEGMHQRAITQMTQSILLLGWALYDPKFAPSLEFLTSKRGTNLFGLQPQNLSDQEAAWNALLDVYGFVRADEMDLLLLEGMRKGFFDEEKLKESAVVVSRNFQEVDAEGDFTQAWRAYHLSFDNNEAEVVQGIFDSFIRNVKVISPLNLNGTVKLLKELNHAQQAAEVIRHYFENREDEQKFYDLNHYAFKEEVTDPDVIEAFRVKHASFRDMRNPKEVLLRVDAGWGDGDLELLAGLSAENYRDIFKAAGPDELPKLINNCFQFGQIVNASEDMKKIAASAKAALTLIGQESDINRRRVRRYGINIENGAA